MSTHWLKLNERELNEPIVDFADGVRLEVSLSPFDVPEAVRGFEEKEGWFTIEFRYPDSEDSATKNVSDVISIDEGKHSGRILKIHVHVDRLNVEQVRLDMKVAEEVTKGLTRFFTEKVGRFAARQERITGRILDENNSNIFRPLVALPR